MVITYEGVEFIKITIGDITVAFNPVSKDSKKKGSAFGADLALVSLKHPDMNGVDAVSRKEKSPFVISGPGEYEVKSYFIDGYLSNSTYEGKESVNTIYSMTIDGINVLYLGALGDSELSPEIKESLPDTDIIFVPIGGDGVLSPKEAYKIAMKREAKVIIPIHFGQVGNKDALKDFLKESGDEGLKAVDKLTIKPKDLVGKQGEVVVLKPLN